MFLLHTKEKGVKWRLKMFDDIDKIFNSRFMRKARKFAERDFKRRKKRLHNRKTFDSVKEQSTLADSKSLGGG